MNKTFLPYSRQHIDDDDIAAVVRVLSSGMLTTGPEVERFEQSLAAYCGARYAVVCANGTAALHLAVLASGLKQGDGVITSPISFLATANCARYVGADVLFADIEAETANLDPVHVEAVLAENRGVKMLLPVHFGGHPARMEELARIAEKHGLQIIEDGCHALGATYADAAGKMVKVGSCRHSTMTVFSFHPVKGMTTGEGGAITTNSTELYEALQCYRSHGMVRSESHGKFFVNSELAFAETGSQNPWYYEMQLLGFNYRLTDFQCALGSSQLQKLDGFIDRKRELAGEYRRQFSSAGMLSRVEPLAVQQGICHAYHLFVVRIDFSRLGLSRAALIRKLLDRQIGTQVHYIPLHMQPYYQAQRSILGSSLLQAENYYEQCLSLPMFPGMTTEDVARVVTALGECLGITGDRQ
jgi:UDP-4-amino-4,6-dideoxy-N-acetyl-beta-L-altrosamine transaminase